MFSSCLYVEDSVDWSYLDRKENKKAVSPKDEKCCECEGVIPSGTEHNHYEGERSLNADSRPGEVDTFLTCQACINIWDSLAGGDRSFGGLSSLIMDAYGIPLDAVPDTDTVEDWQSLADAHDGHDDAFAKQIQGMQPLKKIFSVLGVLDEFVSESQLLTIFEWATSIHTADETSLSLQEQIEMLESKLEMARRQIVGSETSRVDHLIR